ncbi:2'-5' RNA ligase family protein, partial [Thauera linaloolentis]
MPFTHDMPPSPATTIRNARRDFHEWHLGRPHYLLWALDVDLAPVRQRMEAAQHHLSGLLLDDYVRQPHITVSLCGFPSIAPLHTDDFGASLLHAQIDALNRLRPAAFDIGIGALDGFTSAPYLAVDDRDGHIGRLHACLRLAPEALAHADYRPHVTVGLYGGAWPLADVRTRLARFTPGGPLRLRISRLSLLGYASTEIGGRLTPVADYDFARARCSPA